MSDQSLLHFRREYLNGELLEKDLLEDPYQQLMEWLEDAIRSGINDPTAMALATANSEALPSVRIVLLKASRAEGLVFHTNYDSRKGRDLAVNSQASALFFWSGLERQLRIVGKVEACTKEESDSLFNARPADSRIAAIISHQSSTIPARETLDKSFKEEKERIGNGPIQRPDNWGAYILKPASYEFWQGRENRLHDRIQYILINGKWEIRRLAP